MLSIAIPKDTGPAAMMFLQGWSACMLGMAHMTEADKRQVENIFKEIIEPQAMCAELKALDAALIAYLLHKCDAPERVGSSAPKGKG